MGTGFRKGSNCSAYSQDRFLTCPEELFLALRRLLVSSLTAGLRPAAPALRLSAGVSIFLLASCSRKDSMEPLVATVTFWRKALCLAASSGSRRREDVRLGADEVDEDAVDALDSKLEMEEKKIDFFPLAASERATMRGSVKFG